MKMKDLFSGSLVLLLVLGALIIAPPADAYVAMCAGKAVTVDIGAGDTPTNGADVIRGTSGDDVINGMNGADTICGLGGDDTIDGGNANDFISGGAGNDVINGGSGNDTLRGTGGVDQINGGDGNDRIFGDAGNDKLRGDAGADTINGGADSDRIWGGSGHDTINGDDGNDNLYGQSGNDTLSGGNDHDTINGGGGDDSLYGQAGNDTLIGGAEDDTADGGDGTNTCDAEVTSNCLFAPEWTYGAQMSLDSISLFDFNVSWCCASGGDSAPDWFELTITDSAGTSQTEYINAAEAFSFRVYEFQGYAISPDEVYNLEVVAVNEAGRSDTIGIADISQLLAEVQTDVGGAPAAVGAPSSASAGGTESATMVRSGGLIAWGSSYSPNPCDGLSTFYTLKQNKRGWFDELLEFEAISQVCSDGTNIVENITTVACRDDNDKTTEAQYVQSSPDTTQPNDKWVFNEFGCDVTGEGEQRIAVIVSYTGSGGEVVRTDKTYIDVDLRATHRVQAWGAGICWTMSFSPIDPDRANLGDDPCPPISAHTG